MQFGLRTIEEQASNAAQRTLSTAKLSFKTVLAISKDTALTLNTGSVFKDYMYYLTRDNCAYVVFTEENARRYMFKPKLLAYKIYGDADYYALILRLNYMKSVSDFTMDRLTEGIVVPYSSVKDFFSEVMVKEKLPINRNGAKVLRDQNLTQV